MSEYSVIQDIGATMKKLLKEEFESLGAPVNIVFESPSEIQDSNTHTLSIFLFKVEENPHLNNREMQNVNHETLKPPPIVLDLFYLITPFASDRSEEHLMLGRVMQIFYDNSVLKGRILRGDLEGTSVEFHVALYSLPFEEMFQLWQSFTEKSFGLSVCYKVTPVEIDSTREMEAKRVMAKRSQYYQKSAAKVK